ncbi:MAG TPA: hypothetical protein VLS45_02190, partial [Methylomicrobium sp.]|nr:hypothetical protein [Methylomicrobium sp.]
MIPEKTFNEHIALTLNRVSNVGCTMDMGILFEMLLAMSDSKAKGFSRNWRLLGFLPLAFFVARFIYFIHYGGTSQILWLCHISNLTLAVGLLFNLPLWVGISAYWLALGIPFWVVD